MIPNKKGRKKKQDKEREEQRQAVEEVGKNEHSKRRLRRKDDLIDEELFWGTCPTQNSVLMGVDPWLKPRKTIYKAAFKNIWEAVLKSHAKSDCKCGLNDRALFPNSQHEKGTPSQQPVPEPELDAVNQALPPIIMELINNLSSLKLPETSSANNWNTVPPTPAMPGTISLGQQPMNSPRIVSSAATTMGRLSQQQVQAGYVGDENQWWSSTSVQVENSTNSAAQGVMFNEYRREQPIDQTMGINPISTQGFAVYNNYRRLSAQEKQKGPMQEMDVHSGYDSDDDDDDYLRSLPTDLNLGPSISFAELQSMIPEETNQHSRINIVPSVEGSQAFSTCQQFTSHQMDNISSFSMGLNECNPASMISEERNAHVGTSFRPFMGESRRELPLMHEQLQVIPDFASRMRNLEEVLPTILNSPEMNSSNQNLCEAGTFPTTCNNYTVYDPGFEGHGLPPDPIPQYYQIMNTYDRSGWNEVDQIQGILNQGSESTTGAVASIPHQCQGLSRIGSATEAPPDQNQGFSEMNSTTIIKTPFQNQDPPEVGVSTNGVALLQDNEVSNVGVSSFQYQNAQTSLNQGSPLPSIEVSADSQMPNEALEEMIFELWMSMEEGQQDETQNFQQEEQPFYDELRINFKQLDHVQEQQERNVWNNGGQEDIGLNMREDRYKFLAAQTDNGSPSVGSDHLFVSRHNFHSNHLSGRNDTSL